MGSIARYLFAEYATKRFGGSFPYGTIGVNLIGSFLIGVLIILLTQPFLSHLNFRLFLIVGLLGGFTTYSSFSYDLIRLIKDGSMGTALIYLVLTVAGGLSLTFIGILTGNWIVKKL